MCSRALLRFSAAASIAPMIRYGNTGCRRTYLSARDLRAHELHRHVSKELTPAAAAGVPASLPPLPSAAEIADATAALVNARKQQEDYRGGGGGGSSSSSSSKFTSHSSSSSRSAAAAATS